MMSLSAPPRDAGPGPPPPEARFTGSSPRPHALNWRPARKFICFWTGAGFSGQAMISPGGVSEGVVAALVDKRAAIKAKRRASARGRRSVSLFIAAPLLPGSAGARVYGGHRDQPCPTFKRPLRRG